MEREMSHIIINDLMELVNKLFYGDYDENIYIVDLSDREQYKYSEMTVKQIKKYNVRHIDGIVIENGNIYIKI